MSPDPEEIQHESVDREKPLRVRGGFEPAHLSLAAPAAADEPEAQRLSRAIRLLNCPCGGVVLRTECLPLLAHSEHAVVIAAGIDIIPPQLVWLS